VAGVPRWPLLPDQQKKKQRWIKSDPKHHINRFSKKKPVKSFDWFFDEVAGA
jgi:hypothetical protein